MTWIQELIEDESSFPSKTGTAFPKTFLATVKKIFTRLFRVYAHIYHSHFDDVVFLEEETYLATTFKRGLLLFCRSRILMLTVVLFGVFRFCIFHY
jgi:hypothetical protein